MENIFDIKNEEQFLSRCIDVFNFQYNYSPVYRQYVDLLKVPRDGVKRIDDIPFLPIKYFKTKTLIASADPAVGAERIFTSSSTTGLTPSKHYVIDCNLYEESFLRGFKLFYGEPSESVILALLPSYLEREGSSLIYMVKRLISETKEGRSGFFLYNHEMLYSTLSQLQKEKKKCILFGVTFALLDFANKYKLTPSPDWEFQIIETGGMKGRGKEIPRNLLHKILSNSFGVEKIGSEYGMCEMLSQCYSYGDGIFSAPPWAKIVIRGINNPLRNVPMGYRGVINVIDLANVNSCSFIETEDLGTIYDSDGSFSIDGRLDGAERRGCNMLIE